MRFESLDGWRGLAAVFVCLYHLPFLNHLYDLPFLRNSYLFVDFFFVLSGFVISHAYNNKLKNLTDGFTFIYKRIARLWPLHIFILVLFVGLELLKLIFVQTGGWNPDTPPFTNEYSIPSLVSNFFLLHSIGIHDTLTWNYPSWSISVEFYTYLVFVLTALISYKFKRTQKPLMFMLIAASFIILYTNTDNLNQATYNYGIFRCISGFFLGSLCYQFFLIMKDRVIPMATLIEVSLVIGIYFFVVYTGTNKYSLLAPIIFVLTVYVFAFEQGFISKLLKVNLVQNMGKWSYSIYMLHALVILIIGRSFNLIEKVMDQKMTIDHSNSFGPVGDLIFIKNAYLMDIFTIFYLLLVIFFASITYKYIEIRGGRLFRK